ncbi:vacuolar sorting protein 39 domain 2-domain-containing protein [Chytridium lagenaria]|nr:vacuolar sorting protein 39 domain 2-domain-containing protein [Chytridium lagenaria]
MIGSVLEIRSLKSGAIVQKIDMFMYVASHTSLWRLLPLDFEDQIEQLISSSRFIEAQRLIEELDFTTEEEKTANIIRVRGLYAHHLFTYQKKYEEAVSMLAELKASPIDVINLYPQFSLLGPTGELVEDRIALQALLDYLTNQRVILSKLRDIQVTSAAPKLSHHHGVNMRFPSVDDTLYLSEIVDTTLLKVYLAINDALVGPLLRIKNFCNLRECEGILEGREKYRELTDLYFGKGEHDKALKFLLKRAQQNEDNVKPVVSYLMRLDLITHLPRIFTYSEWILKVHPETGLSIFIERYEEIPTKVHQDILDFLEKISAASEARYLEHMVDELHIDAPEFHDRLVLNYLQTIMRNLMVERFDGDDDVVEVLRGKLESFLRTSKFFRADRLLPLFPDDVLYEERAILLGRLSRHREALTIYINILGSLESAENYCITHESPLEDVYILLLEILLSQLRVNAIDENDVLDYLSRYSHKIDIAKAFLILPSTISVKDVIGFCRRSVQSLLWKRDSEAITENLVKADHLEVQALKVQLQSRRVTITEDRMCPRCLRRVGNSVFAAYPNGGVVHVFCQSREGKSG